MTLEPTVVAAAIAAVAAAVVSIINAIANARDRRDAREERRLLLEHARGAAQKVDIVAEKAKVIAERAENTEQKLDSIKATTEQSARDVDGNLLSVRKELAAAAQHNEALQATITTLTDIIKVQQSAPGS